MSREQGGVMRKEQCNAGKYLLVLVQSYTLPSNFDIPSSGSQ